MGGDSSTEGRHEGTDASAMVDMRVRQEAQANGKLSLGTVARLCIFIPGQQDSGRGSHVKGGGLSTQPWCARSSESLRVATVRKVGGGG